MAHAVPSAGFETHGLFTYPLKFFFRIAKANDYECLDAWMSIRFDVDEKQFKSDVAQFYMDYKGMFRNARLSKDHPIYFYNLTYDNYRSVDACIYVFLRKTNSREFQIPTDLPDDHRG